jgi:hypothetical protein
MSLAVANLLGVNAINVVLDFAPASSHRRRIFQAGGVLVTVGLTEFQGFSASFASRVAQDKLDAEMTSVGLRHGQLIAGTHIVYNDTLLCKWMSSWVDTLVDGFIWEVKIA